MKKIVLICAAGMSTSLLVNKMREAATALGVECEINAYPVADSGVVIEGSDCVLLGPQVRYELTKLQSQYPEIPIAAIEMTSYGMMDGQAVLKQALMLIGE